MHPSAALCLLACTASAVGQTAISPASRSTLEGSSYSHFPLGRHDARFQFLYADVPGARILNGHAYRRDATSMTGRIEGFVAELEVTLSVAPHEPGAASPWFANNEGQNPTIVLPRSTLAFPQTDRPALDPAASFDFIVPYHVPYVLPVGPSTLCLDVVMHGNASPLGSNRNLSVFLDAHELQTNGTTEQPGFRTGPGGCPAPGSNAPSYANLALWHLGGAGQLDVSIRRGIADDGSARARAFLCLGTAPVQWPWPPRPGCLQQSSTEVWFPLPGPMTTNGRYDQSVTGLPPLPPGYRLWCQAGSIHLGSGALAFADLSSLTTPPAAAETLPAARVAASSNRLAVQGTISHSVPVTLFF